MQDGYDYYDFLAAKYHVIMFILNKGGCIVAQFDAQEFYPWEQYLKDGNNEISLIYLNDLFKREFVGAFLGVKDAKRFTCYLYEKDQSVPKI